MDKELEDDHQGLLQDDTSFILGSQQRETIKNLRRLLVLASFLIVVLVCITLWSVTHVNAVDPTLRTWSPANVAVEYEEIVFYDGLEHFSPFQMPPDDHVDEIWLNLYTGITYMKVPAVDTAKLPNQTMVFPGTEGDGMVTLEVFHLLHCLDSLRQGLFPERYPRWQMLLPNGTRDESKISHQVHCLDRIRQDIMCHSNTGTNYWKWNDRRQEWAVGMETTHTCRNFDKILEWARQRGTDMVPEGWTVKSPGKLTPKGRQ